MNTKRISLLLLSFVMVFALCAFTACKGKDEDGGEANYTPGAEVGSYYCVVDGAESTLSISQNGAVTLNLDKEEFSGQCSKSDGSSNELTISFGGALFANATYNNNVLTFLFKGNEYRYLRDVNYTVTFDSMGGSAVAALTVRNGKTAQAPAQPTKEGMTFFGWYRDKEFKTPFQFGAEAISGDITLYASFVASVGNEVDVNMYLNYEGAATLEPQKTVGGIAQLPQNPEREGYVFLGWYVSQYNDASKLSYKYDGQSLYEPTSLYAVWGKSATDVLTVSVDGDTISWNDLGLGGTSTVYVYSGNDVIDSASVQETSYEFAFSGTTAGDYKVVVRKGGKEGSAYIKNKALAKVSIFQTSNGTALSFNAVPGAEEYVLEINCGNKYHNHSSLSIGTATTYNFANCDMQKGGITFKVTAKKKGYMSSVSDVYAFEQGLDSVEGVKVDENGNLTWNAVDKAEYYEVTVALGENTETYYLTETSLSLANFGEGNYTFGVTAVADTYYSPDATVYAYAKTNIAAPSNLRLNERTLEWDAVEGADSYILKLDGKVFATPTKPSYTLIASNMGETSMVSVCAVKNNVESFYSDEVKIIQLQQFDSTSLTYKNGVVYWTDVFGATKYQVEVSGAASYKVTLTAGISNKELHSIDLTEVIKASGEYTVKVTAFASVMSFSGTIDFSIYSLQFEPNKGTTAQTMYLAEGDDLVLPESEKGGYNFIGWYNTVDGAASNGKAYRNGTFKYKADMTVYAGWDAKTYTVTLKWKDGDTVQTDKSKVRYKEAFTLPVPETAASEYAFEGWYSGNIKFTDEYGKSTYNYDRIDDCTLEANFVKVLDFTLNPDGKSYEVKKNNYIGLLTEVTIPKEYNGLPVTTINGAAFDGATKLKVINIPDTIKLVFIGLEGIRATGSAFSGCTNLEEINIYQATEIAGERGGYESHDGALYHYNETTKELDFDGVPTKKEGELVIASGVKTLSENALYLSKINTVVVPASVTKIEKRFFYSCSNLTSVVFEEPEEGTISEELVFADEAFYSCSNLLEITLPARMSNLNGSMFRSCSKLALVDFNDASGKYYSVDGVVMQKGEDNLVTLVYCPTGKTGDYVIPKEVSKIGDYAFTARYESTSSTATDPYTYTGCTKLTSVTIHNGVSEIGVGAFRGCTGVTKVVFEGTKNSVELAIKQEAFYGMTNSAFESITLPAKLVSLGKYAFGGCTHLTTVYLDSVDCSGFEQNAFGKENSTLYYVTDVHIGPDTSAIALGEVFGTKLANVYVDENNENYVVGEDKLVYDKAIENILFVPSEFSGEYTTPDTLKAIAANAFVNRKNLTKVTIGKNVASVGDSAFSGCNALEEVAFEERESDLVFGNTVFASCVKLTYVALPEHTTEIGGNLFNGCYGITELSLPSTLTKIGLVYDTTLKKDVLALFGVNAKLVVEKITVAEGNDNYASLGGVLYEKNDGVIDTLVYVPRALTGTVDVPKTVTKIADRAFYYACATKLIFSEGIVEGATLEFGDAVFSNSELREIELPRGLVSIGNNMFYGCDTLESISIPNTVTSIGEYAFYDCKLLQSIVIPNSVEYIGNRAFYNCKSLTSLTFEEGNDAQKDSGEFEHPLVLEDGTNNSDQYGNASYNGIFNYTKFTELVLPRRTTYIGDYLMGYNSSSYGTNKYPNTTLKKVVIPEGIEYIGKYAFYTCEALEEVEFLGESRLSGVLEDTFMYCSNLKKIELPESSESSGYSLKYTLSGTAVESIVIPASVTSMEYAFNNCKNLTSVSYKENSKLDTLKQSFSGCTALETVILPDGLKTIESLAFYNLTGLKSITIPKTVQTIRQSAFSGASNLAEIIFATYGEEDGDKNGKCDLATIEYQAFKGTAISEFVFPVSTEDSITLGGGTTSETSKGRLFMTCQNLTKVTLSASIKNIDFVFKDCTSLEEIIIAEDNTSFSKKDGKPYIYNQAGTAIVYVTATLPAGVYNIESDIEEISPYAFEGQANITEVVIPYTVQKIGAGAFKDCIKLTKVTIENTVTHPSQIRADEIGGSVFSGCKSLVTVELPNTDGMTSIPANMFEGTSITSIVIPASVTKIGGSAFKNCADLTEVTFETGSQLTELANYAFDGAAFETISLPATLKTINLYVFNNNHNLKEVIFLKDASGNTALTTIMGSSFGNSTASKACSIEQIVLPKSLVTLTGSAFINCTSLKSVVFEADSKCTTIGSSAFKNTAITSFTFPKGVKTLESSLFYGCADLAEVIIPADSSMTKVNGSAFDGCTSLTEIDLPKSITTLASKAFYNATSLTEVNFAEGTKLAASGIAANAFDNCVSLTSIDIPEGLTTLAAQAFLNCTSLKSVTLPSTLTTFNAYVFLNCASLESVTIPASVITIGNYLFSGCTSLTSVEFEEGTKILKLGDYMFADYAGTSAPKYPASACTSLTEFTFPDSLKGIGQYVFRNCTALETVTFGSASKLVSVGIGAFQYSGIKQIELPKGVTTLGTYSYNSTKQTLTATSPSVTTSIYTFQGCKNLETVTFLGNVTAIGGYVFYGCTSLTMDVPSTVKTIGQFAFANTGATEYNLPSTVTSLGNNVFAYNQNLAKITSNTTKYVVDDTYGALVSSAGKVVCYPAGRDGVNGVINVPDGVTIDAYAFAGCDKVHTINLPENTTEIPNYAFYDAVGLTSFTVPKGVTQLGSTYALGYIFTGCTSLAEVKFLGNVELIGGYVFKGCTSLTEITLPESVNTVGYGAFAGTGIKEFTFKEGVTYNKSTSESSQVFKDSALETVVVNTPMCNYMLANLPSLKNVTFGENVTTIPNYAFKNTTGLESITIPAHITSIGNYAFQGCTSLVNVVFETETDAETEEVKGVTSIGDYAFSQTSSFGEIEIPSTVTTLGKNVFNESGVIKATIPATVATIGTGLFYNATRLSTVILGEGMTKLVGSMFYGCTSLKTIDLPDTITYLGSSTFKASGIETIKIPKGVKAFATSATAVANVSTYTYLFENCVNLKQVIFHDEFEAITGKVFAGCTSLEEIVLPDSLTIIGTNAFNGCTSLKKVTMSKNLEQLGTDAFTGCTQLEKIVFTAPLTTVNNTVFGGWTDAQTICFKFGIDKAGAWSTSWNVSCNANVVWNYTGE